jgi:hypothetical protein
LEILNFAVKHGHVDLANEAARQSMGHGLADAHAVLEPDTFKNWVSVCSIGEQLKLHKMYMHTDILPRTVAPKVGCVSCVAFARECESCEKMPQ